VCVGGCGRGVEEQEESSRTLAFGLTRLKEL